MSASDRRCGGRHGRRWFFAAVVGAAVPLAVVEGRWTRRPGRGQWVVVVCSPFARRLLICGASRATRSVAAAGIGVVGLGWAADNYARTDL